MNDNQQKLISVDDLIEALPFPCWVVDASFKTRHYNSALVRLAGVENLKRDELLGQGVRSWFRIPELYEAIQRGPVASEKIEIQINGAQFEIQCSPMGYGLLLIVFQEVTSVRRAEQFRSDLVANVSHELRTPLTAIKGFAETLQEDLKLGAVDTAQDHVAIISRNADRLMSLIDDLLVLSRLESGKDELQIQALDTQSITSQAIDGLTELQRRMGHQVKVECSASTVFGDPLRVEQVLTNLIGNALRYAPATSGPVVVVWRETAKDVVLEVSDSGPGIPSELHDRIFERFFRIDFGRSRDSGGTGLGLAIVKHILQRHGGRIELESAPGQGTRFLCFFPKR